MMRLIGDRIRGGAGGDVSGAVDAGEQRPARLPPPAARGQVEQVDRSVSALAARLYMRNLFCFVF